MMSSPSQNNQPPRSDGIVRTMFALGVTSTSMSARASPIRRVSVPKGRVQGARPSDRYKGLDKTKVHRRTGASFVRPPRLAPAHASPTTRITPPRTSPPRRLLAARNRLSTPRRAAEPVAPTPPTRSPRSSPDASASPAGSRGSAFSPSASSPSSSRPDARCERRWRTRRTSQSSRR